MQAIVGLFDTFAAAQGGVGALLAAGFHDEDISYAAHVGEGGAQVVVTTSGEQATRAEAILRDHGAIKIYRRGDDWQAGDQPHNQMGEGGGWSESSKIGTTTASATGAATGALIGAAGGPAGAVIGGIAGAALGGGVGAAGDAAGEKVLPHEEYRSVNDYETNNSVPGYFPSQQDADAPAPPETALPGGHGRFETFEPDFHRHYQEHFGSSSLPYQNIRPYYEYGYMLATNKYYAGRDWQDIEPEARRNWEQQAHSPWDTWSDTIRFAWAKVRNVISR